MEETTNLTESKKSERLTNIMFWKESPAESIWERTLRERKEKHPLYLGVNSTDISDKDRIQYNLPKRKKDWRY